MVKIFTDPRAKNSLRRLGKVYKKIDGSSESCIPGCGYCCYDGSVMHALEFAYLVKDLTKDELKDLADAPKITFKAGDKYTNCMFLDVKKIENDGRLYGTCVVYENRPSVCRIFSRYLISELEELGTKLEKIGFVDINAGEITTGLDAFEYKDKYGFCNGNTIQRNNIALQILNIVDQSTPHIISPELRGEEFNIGEWIEYFDLV